MPRWIKFVWIIQAIAPISVCRTPVTWNNFMPLFIVWHFDVAPSRELGSKPCKIFRIEKCTIKITIHVIFNKRKKNNRGQESKRVKENNIFIWIIKSYNNGGREIDKTKTNWNFTSHKRNFNFDKIPLKKNYKWTTLSYEVYNNSHYSSSIPRSLVALRTICIKFLKNQLKNMTIGDWCFSYENFQKRTEFPLKHLYYLAVGASIYF